MIAPFRFMPSLTLCACLGITGASVEPVKAQPICESESITAKSGSRIRGEAFAKKEAEQKWVKAAEERFGKIYGRWVNAKDSSVECEFVKSKRLDLPATICTAIGRPCQHIAAIDEKQGDKVNGRDRDSPLDRPSQGQAQASEQGNRTLRYTLDDVHRFRECHARARAVGDERPTRAKAQRAADQAWMGTARYKLGERYQDLNYAKDVRHTCRPSSTTDILKRVFFRCAVEATPCRAPLDETNRAKRRWEQETDDEDR